MDTVRILTSPLPQEPFLRPTDNNRPAFLIGTYDQLVLATLKWVLGEDFLHNEDCYKLRIYIPSRFMGSIDPHFCLLKIEHHFI